MTIKTSTQPVSLEALRAGDRESFARLVDAYSTPLYRLALRLVGDPQEAEDVLQETFLNAYRGLAGFGSRSSLGTWLYRIATNQALMRLRRKEPQQVSVDEPPIGPEGELPRQLFDWCCLPEEDFMTAGAQAELEAAIAALSPTLRSVFVLRDLHGLSTEETAEVLEISPAAVKTRLLRARLKLRERLSGYFTERAREAGYG
ncbi:MAG: RNA polymerase sigma factor [Chloroflexota bacterium]